MRILCCSAADHIVGVGIATMAVVFFLDIYYCVIIAWTFFYLIATFTALPDLPWNTCGRWQWQLIVLGVAMATYHIRGWQWQLIVSGVAMATYHIRDGNDNLSY